MPGLGVAQELQKWEAKLHQEPGVGKVSKVTNGGNTGRHKGRTGGAPLKREALPLLRPPAIPPTSHRGAQGKKGERALTVAHGSGSGPSNLSLHSVELSFPARCRSACVSVGRGSTSLPFCERERHRAFRHLKSATGFALLFLKTIPL